MRHVGSANSVQFSNTVATGNAGHFLTTVATGNTVHFLIAVATANAVHFLTAVGTANTAQFLTTVGTANTVRFLTIKHAPPDGQHLHVSGWHGILRQCCSPFQVTPLSCDDVHVHHGCTQADMVHGLATGIHARTYPAY